MSWREGEFQTGGFQRGIGWGLKKLPDSSPGAKIYRIVIYRRFFDEFYMLVSGCSGNAAFIARDCRSLSYQRMEASIGIAEGAASTQ